MKTLKEIPNNILPKILSLSGKKMYFIPIAFFALLIATIFVVEVGIMGLLLVLPDIPESYKVYLDGFLLTIILFPVLFYFYLRPTLAHIRRQRESERRFRAVFEQTFQFMCILNPNGTIVQANQSAVLASALTHKDIVGKYFWDAFKTFIPAEANTYFHQAIDAAAQGYLTRFEQDFALLEGEAFTVDVSIKPIMDEQGQVMMVILEGRDVTHRKQIEQELRSEIVKRQEKEARIQQSARQAIVLSEILNSLQEVNEDFQLFLETAAAKTAELFGDGCIIHLLSENSQQLIPVAYYHKQPEIQQKLAQMVGIVPNPVADGLQGHVTASRTTLFLPSVDANQLETWFIPAYRTYFAQFGLRSLMLFPIQIQGRLLGTLFLFRDSTLEPYAQEDLEFVQNIALKAAMAVHNARLYQAEKRSRQMAETMGAAALALTQTLKLEYILDKLLDYVEVLIPFDTACIALLEDEDRLAVRLVRGRDIWLGLDQPFNLTLNGGANLLVEMPVLTQRSLLIPDAQKFPGWQTTPGIETLRSWLGVPLVTGHKAIGLCILGKETEDSFTQDHIQWAEAMLSQAAVAIQNAWLFEQVRAGRERLQSLSHRLVEVQENERRYIARELHDEAGQALTSLMVGLRLIERDAHQPKSVLAGTVQLKRVVDEVLENLHRLAVHLRPASLDHLGLIPSLQQYIADFSQRHNLLVQFETMGVEARLRTELETALYRIVQEALTNVIKHAQATRVDVLLERRGEKLITIIEDNGQGFDTSTGLSGDHLGLFGIRERLEMFGGVLHLESSPGMGTTLFAEVPYDTQNPHR